MKPYFAKYLPVEGEIKYGDKYSHPKWEGIYTHTDSLDVVDYSDCNKVKLFLCSRDIQIEDIVSISGGETGVVLHEHDLIYYWKVKNAYKPIGEISPEAIWVKEGMEFDEEEIRRTFISANGMYITPTSWNEELAQKMKNARKCTVLIKGPCGHFH